MGVEREREREREGEGEEEEEEERKRVNTYISFVEVQCTNHTTLTICTSYSHYSLKADLSGKVSSARWKPR